jgi:hypothetical protein
MSAGVTMPQASIVLGAQRVYINAPVSLAAVTAAHVFLVINGIQFDKPPGAHYKIYFNLPARILPSFENAFFVGNLSFFRGANSQPYSEVFDITSLFLLQVETGVGRTDVARLTLVLQGSPATPGAAITMAPGANVQIAGAVVTDTLPGVSSP